jgi:hypothetical protein
MGKSCKAITRSGKPCQAYAADSGYCFHHDPHQAEARAAARKLGGYNRRTHPGSGPADAPQNVRKMSDVLEVLDLVLSDALKLENSISRGRLLVAIVEAYTKAIVTGDMESRMAAIEAAITANQQPTRVSDL